jgi:O-antigen ligase
MNKLMQKSKMTKEKDVNSTLTDLRKRNDRLFIISVIIFNIGVSGVYLASKFNNEVLLQTFGAIVVLLFIPFTVSLLGYLKIKAEKKITTSLVIILLYLVLEIILDYILKIPFRDILVLHIFYIIIFYAASFSMIGVSFNINRKIGFIVLITFLILIGCLIYMYLG